METGESWLAPRFFLRNEMIAMAKKRWSDLTDTQKVAIVLLGTLQFALLAAALWDIRRRPAAEINGSKALWALVSFINFVGPVAYFAVGRKREVEDGTE
jgi:hypothetical protein